MKQVQYLYAVIAVVGLALIYLFQRFDYLAFFRDLLAIEMLPTANFTFAFNRVSRFILNDLFAILLIFALFRNRNYVLVAFAVQLFGLLVVLPLYLYLKLTIEGPSEISSPLLSHLHRIIIHPVMILLLIPAFYFKRKPTA